MKNFDWFSVFLFGSLGMVMSMNNLSWHTWGFWSIMLIVSVIDLHSYMRGYRT
jgi:hypothetical protein